jgi:protease-4
MRTLKTMRLAAVVLSALVAGGCTINANVFGGKRAALSEVGLDGAGETKDSDGKLLLISVEGTITSEDTRSLLGGTSNTVDDIRRQLAKAEGDPAVKAVILRVNSPGGGATASDTIYHEIKSWKERTKVPVVAFFQDTAASGGYYISMAADELVAQPTTITGSIGVIAVFMDVNGLLDKLGVKAHVVRSSKFKASLNPLIEKSAEDLAQAQALIDQMYGQFLGVVQVGRKNLTAARAKELADGRVYMGEEARQLGLVDHIGYFEKAVERAEALAGRKGLTIVTYTTDAGDPDRTYYTRPRVEASEFPVALDVADKLGLASGSTSFLYYWSP